MHKKTLAIVAVIIVVGIAAAAAILRTPPATTTSAEGAEGPGPLDYPRGPHGARLLADEALQVEMTIYETGVPPHFRIYPYDASQKPIPPTEVNLVVELHRLGGRVDRITFTPEADYLRGNEVIEEPHSFDVKVSATRSGRQHSWSYSQIEGKVQLGADQIKSAGITIATVGAREMTTTLELPGEVKADQTRVAHVVPRLQGVVDQVLKKEGDRVRKGEVIAVMSSRELADAKRDYIEAAHDAEYRAGLFEREEMLWKKKISAENEYRLAEKLAEEARLAQKLAGQKLIVLGVPGNTLDGLATAPAETMARYEIRSPLDGVVLERNVTVGEAVTADEIVAALGDQVALILNDGRSRLGQPSTVVRVGRQSLEVLRQGVVSEQTLKRLSTLMILLVCTGNTCRSPMAEALCRKLIADKLGCPIQAIGDHGVMVASAGIAAMLGNRPSPEAVTVMAEEGLNLSDHESQPLTGQLVRQADIIWAMTRSHRQTIVAQWPEAAPRTWVLGQGETDIPDPIGGPVEHYAQCAALIKKELAARIETLAVS